MDGHGPAVDLQYDRTQHLLGILFAFGVRNLTVAVSINLSEYFGRQSGAGREVNLQIYALNIDREPRGLKIFIHTMSGGRSCQPPAQERE